MRSARPGVKKAEWQRFEITDLTSLPGRKLRDLECGGVGVEVLLLASHPDDHLRHLAVRYNDRCRPAVRQSGESVEHRAAAVVDKLNRDRGDDRRVVRVQPLHGVSRALLQRYVRA